MGEFAVTHTSWPKLTLGRLAARLRGHDTVDRLRERGVTVGDDVRIASRTFIDTVAPFAVSIGDDTIIAHDVLIIAHDASIKHVTGYTLVKPTSIGRSCYIGARATVLAGVTIGDGAVIGAGAVVTHDVGAGKVAIGTPAREVGDVEELKRRHLASSAPRFDVRALEASAATRAEMSAALRREGALYMR
jgi:maltose O-acetyltransferase